MQRMWNICLVSLLLAVCSSSDVRLPPNILVHPNDTIFRPDARILLECAAEGVPDVAYTWEHNGEPLELHTGNINKIGDYGDIVIDPAYRLDEGEYQCFAQNQYGIGLSRVATLNYAVLDVINTPVQEFTVSVGESLELPCAGVTSYPTPQYTWAIADNPDAATDTPLETSTRIQVDFQGSLHFSNAVTEDGIQGKVYKCVVRNPYLDKSAGGNYARVTVLGGSPSGKRPELTYTSGPTMIGLVGQGIKLKCLYKGFSTPTVAWGLQNGQLPPSRNIIAESGTELHLSDLRFTDTGSYECVGSNSVDRVTTVIALDIQSVPTFRRKDPNNPNSLQLKPSNLNKTEAEAASFLCVPDAVPDASIQWLINGVEIDSENPGPRRSVSADGTNLTVINLCKNCGDGSSDLMVVQCIIANVHGAAYAQGYLNVLEETIMTEVPKDVNMADWETAAMFNCSATTDPSTPLTYKWLHDSFEVDTSRPGYKIVGTNLVVNPMEEEDEDQQSKMAGEYKCVVSNGYSPKNAAAHLTLPVVEKPIIIDTASFNILDFWWVFLILVLILLLILLCCCCYHCYQRNKGDEYLVDEKDRQNGFDPEKELADSGFHDFRRPESTPFKGSRASLTSTIKIDTDDEASLLEYGEPDTGKFNEDGSFIGQYHERSKRHNDSTV